MSELNKISVENDFQNSFIHGLWVIKKNMQILYSIF